MPQNQNNPADMLRALHSLQQKKVSGILKFFYTIAFILCLIAAGLGALWFVKSSWVALIFGVILAIAGIGLFIVAYTVSGKLSTFNSAATGAMNIYDSVKSNNVVDINVVEKNHQESASTQQYINNKPE